MARMPRYFVENNSSLTPFFPGMGAHPVGLWSEGALYSLHGNAIGAPVAVTDARNTVVWRWEPRPFGDSVAEDDPDGDGGRFTLNLRFPGQYFDQETGLHYNYFRTYDPGTGRYTTSDPIGLNGGLNTYIYGRNNPLFWIDPFGLDTLGIHSNVGPNAGFTDGHAWLSYTRLR